MFTNDSILHIAMQQSAIEYNCAIDAFMQQQSINPALRINFRKKIPRRAVPLLARFIRKKRCSLCGKSAA